jgi:hypothetical protein
LGGRQTPDQCAQWVPDAAQHVSAMQAHNALSKNAACVGVLKCALYLRFISQHLLPSRPETYVVDRLHGSSLVNRREFMECTKVTRTGHTIHQKKAFCKGFPLMLLVSLCMACATSYGLRKFELASCTNREPGSLTGSQLRDQPRLQNIVLSIPNAVIIHTL